MAVKAVLASLEGVDEHLAPLYKAGEGGKFYLEVEGLEDGSEHPAVGSLARAKKRESEARAKAEAAAKELRDQLDATTLEKENLLKGTVPKDNFVALEASYKERSEREKAEIKAALEGEIGKLSSSLKTVLVDNVAQSLAAKLASDPIHIPLLLPHITKRLSVEMVDGKATTRVLDKDGMPSAATPEDLAKEILGTPMFSAVLAGSKATGGGASGGSGGGGAPQKKPGPNASAEEWAAWAKAKRTGG